MGKFSLSPLKFVQSETAGVGMHDGFDVVPSEPALGSRDGQPGINIYTDIVNILLTVVAASGARGDGDVSFGGCGVLPASCVVQIP